MILFNGASGSLGQYFAGALADAARSGHALRARLEDRSGLGSELAALARLGLPGGPAAVRAIWFVQMAAKVSVPECERDPQAARRTNVTDPAATALDFVRWARAQGAEPHVVLVSSGHVYAAQAHGSRVCESDALAPRSVYARTKLEGEQALGDLAAEHAFPLTIARVFGLLAPRQPPNYMLQGMLRRARLLDLRAVPGLGFRRDFLDARDVCQHLVQLCRPQISAAGSGGFNAPRILNVCSGVPVELRDILGQLLELVHPGRGAQLLAQAGEAPGRPDDIPWIVGDPSALEAELGEPSLRTPLSATLRDALAAAPPA